MVMKELGHWDLGLGCKQVKLIELDLDNTRIRVEFECHNT